MVCALLLMLLANLNFTRRDFVHTIAIWLSEGLAEMVTPINATKENQVSLPDWVVARLKQDNVDLSHAIVDMVIWVDRVKCWMYQADADLDKALGEIKAPLKAASGDFGAAKSPPGQEI
jgi:hypothetical protein